MVFNLWITGIYVKDFIVAVIGLMKMRILAKVNDETVYYVHCLKI